MTDARLKLVGALALAGGALCSAMIIVFTGMMLSMPVADIVALSAIPGSIGTTALGYVVGHSNGANGMKSDLQKLANAKTTP